MKTCTKCKQEKQTDQYFKASRSADGKQSICKACMNVAYAVSRSKKHDHYLAVARSRRSSLTNRIREWKEERGCLFCDEEFGPCLELHHADPSQKDFDPSEAAGKSWKLFLEEAEKCVVLCACCHRKVHHGMISLLT